MFNFGKPKAARIRITIPDPLEWQAFHQSEVVWSSTLGDMRVFTTSTGESWFSCGEHLIELDETIDPMKFTWADIEYTEDDVFFYKGNPLN